MSTASEVTQARRIGAISASDHAMEQPSSSPRSPRSLWLWAAAAVLVLGFAFQGSRGIWEPDEGFYSNVALGMLRTGDWLVPRLNDQPFLDKPPLLYWSVAGSMKALGVNEWSVRAPHALWFAGTSLLLGALATLWWGRRTGLVATAVYALSLLPFAAANVLTPDTPLAFAVALGYLLFWRLEQAADRRTRVLRGAALGLAIGIGVLAKGPAMLMFMAPLGVHAAIRRRSVARLFEPGFVATGLVALAVGAPWYLAIAGHLPGAARYFLDNQVVGRLVSPHYARNSGLFDGLVLYLPVLVLGSLPWSAFWLGWLARLRPGRPDLRRLRDQLTTLVTRRPIALLLVLWMGLPLAVLVLARSRLPLYVLPLFGPLTLATSHRLARPRPAVAARHRGTLAWAAVWVIALLVLKAVPAQLSSDRDARRLARQLGALGVPAERLLVTVDTRHNGLAFYGYHRLEQVTFFADPYPFFSMPERFSEEVEEIREREASPVLLMHSVRGSVATAALDQHRIPVTTEPLEGGLILLTPGAGSR